jgi:hypothetical protein
MAVQVDDDDVIMLLQQPWNIVQAGRIGRKLPDFASLAPSQSSGRRLAALLVRADQSNL